ncbi:MAG: putative maltokinase, partial [Dehalococcoidia bacterium]
SNWAWDPVAGQYYWHRFFSHQPDLNYANPEVRRAIRGVMKFWFDRGVDGLRLDAVPYLCEREGTNNENLAETHEVIKEWRAFVDEHYPDRMLLAEANQWPEDVRAYFGDGDECHMAFNFPVMPRLFMGLRQEDRRPIVDIMEQTPPIPESAQWVLFLRNHDELTLEMVTDEERDYMYSIFATDPRMRVNVGIRRRLAPLVDNNRRAIELLHALLFSLPGTPVIYYGDELAMGDNVFLGDRDGVRTPMQWSGDRNAGFSRADAARLYLPLVTDPLYGYAAVNVEAQERTASSLLNWMRRMIALRRRRPVLGHGDLTMLHPSNRSVLAFLRTDGDETLLVVANLSRFVQPVELDLTDFAGVTPVEVIGQQTFPPVGETPYFLSLGPHAFLWFDLVPQPAPVATPEETGPVLRVGGDWPEILAGEALRELEREALPAYIARQRWFGGKDAPVGRVSLRDIVPVQHGAAPAWVMLADVEAEDAAGQTSTATYTLVLAIATGRGARQLLDGRPNAVIAHVEAARGRGILCDAMVSEGIGRELLELTIGQSTPTGGSGARLQTDRFPGFHRLYDALEDPVPVNVLSEEQSNSSVRFGQQIMLKLLRRFELEPHPEIEMGRHLASHPTLTPRLLGVIALNTEQGRGPVAVAHEFVWSRGNAWDLTVAMCRHFLDDHIGEEPPPGYLPNASPAAEAERARDTTPEEITFDYTDEIHALGGRTAELHLALAEPGGDEAFAPEPLLPDDLEAVHARIRQRFALAEPALTRVAEGDDPHLAEQAAAVLGMREHVDAWLETAPRAAEGVAKIRVHGDYHLGQVIAGEGGFVILDFEGEVGLPIEERRRKMSVFTDVAGMLRSLSYASLTAERTQAQSYPDVEPALDRLTGWVAWWEERAAAAFLAGYLETAGDAPFLPRSPQQQRALLDLYLLDKALHELHYEVEHRPDWLWIPLDGLARLARRQEGGDA